MQVIRRRLGVKIRELREKKDLSQEEFAEVCGLHRTYIGSVERGERNLTLASIETIAKALGISIFQLFRRIG